MSVMYRINQGYATFTDTERRIADYILEHSQDLVTISSTLLAKDTNTSTSAWNRFARKIGYEGIKELKIELVQKTDLDENIGLIIEENDSIETLFSKEYKLVNQSVKTTLGLLNSRDIMEAAAFIDQAERIFIVGIGGSSIMAMDFMQKLSRIGKTVMYQNDPHVLLTMFPHITPQDVLIAVSYSGETNVVVVGAEVTKEAGAPIISITGYNPQSTLAKHSDCNLFIPIQEKDVRLGAIQSRYSTFIVMDLLYFALVSKDFEKTKEALVVTRDVIHKLTTDF